jgi:predicted GNAT family acetyltransferase
MTVRHDLEGSRFVVPLRDGDAQLVYAPFGDDILDLQHTEVPPSGPGEGVADARGAAGRTRLSHEGSSADSRKVNIIGASARSVPPAAS